MFVTLSEIQNQQKISKIKISNSLNENVTTETDRNATGAMKRYVRS